MTVIGTARARLTLIVALIAVVVAPGVAASAAPTVVLPPPDGRFDYQLGGAYVPSPDVAVVSRDRTARPVTGVYSVCYVNAFQTQPGERGFWTVEPDNLDSWTRSERRLTRAGNIALATLLVRAARARPGHRPEEHLGAFTVGRDTHRLCSRARLPQLLSVPPAELGELVTGPARPQSINRHPRSIVGGG